MHTCMCGAVLIFSTCSCMQHINSQEITLLGKWLAVALLINPLIIHISLTALKQDALGTYKNHKRVVALVYIGTANKINYIHSLSLLLKVSFMDSPG